MSENPERQTSAAPSIAKLGAVAAAAKLSQAIEVLRYLEDFQISEFRPEQLAKVREMLANAVRLIGEAT